ncbi:MAG: hypothetical protein ACT4QC_00575, partial [Planctomycetaceae bacterium]
SNPNQGDQSAPIAITVTEFDDPHSTFIGLQQPAVTFPINDTDFKTVANETAAVITFTNAPGEGIEFIRIDTTLKIPILLFPPLETLVYTPDAVPAASNQTEESTSVVSKVDAASLRVRQVFLVVLNAAGEELNRALVDEDVLDDLPGFFRRLPDGRYQVLLKDPGEREARLLIDVTLRGGKPADDSEGNLDKPPTEQAPAPVDSQALPADSAALTAPPSDAGAAEPVPNAAAASDPGPALGVSHTSIERAHRLAAAFDAIDWRRPTTGWASAAAGGLALAAVLGQRDWEERVDRALAGPEAGRLSKGARLARRLRRQLRGDGRHALHGPYTKNG